MARRTVAAAVAVAVALLPGCGVLPEPPDSESPPTAPGTAGPSGQAEPVGLREAERAAVRVRNITCQGVASGSGFALGDDLLVTNAHVIEGAAALQLNTYDGRELEVTAAAAATVADLALVRTTGDLPAALPIADSDPTEGDEVTVAGYPRGGRLRTSTGTVLSYTDDALGVNVDQVFATDAQVAPGSSGSAVVDADSAVVGVVYAASERGTAYAVPVSELRALLAEPAAFSSPAPCE